MVRTRAGATTTGHFDFGALPDELQERICGFAGRDAITLSMASRATHNAREHLVNGLLKLFERPNGAEGILDGMNKMCRLRWGPLFECCRDPRFRHPKYEWQRVACVVRAARVARDQFLHRRRLMHILINKLGGCRGAEAEGEVMALFVALFATAADEDYLMERFQQGLVKLFRLYSLGTDALAVADTALRFGAAYERAGFAEMHLPAFCLRFSRVDVASKHVPTQAVGVERSLRRVGRAGLRGPRRGPRRPHEDDGRHRREALPGPKARRPKKRGRGYFSV